MRYQIERTQQYVEIESIHGVLVFPSHANATLKERSDALCALATKHNVPAITSFKGIGMMANPRDQASILRLAWGTAMAKSKKNT